MQARLAVKRNVNDFGSNTVQWWVPTAVRVAFPGRMRRTVYKQSDTSNVVELTTV